MSQDLLIILSLGAALLAGCGTRGDAIGGSAEGGTEDGAEAIEVAPAPPTTRTGKVGKKSKSGGADAGKAKARIGPSPTAQRTVLPFNNATAIARVGDGLLTLYRQDGDARLARSRAGTEPEVITVASGNIGGLAMATDGDAVLVTFSRGNGLYAALSEDGGATFAEAWTVVSGSGSPQGPAARLWRSEAGLRAVVLYHLGNQITGQLYTATLMDGKWGAPTRLDGDGEGSWGTLEGEGDWTVAVWKDFKHREREPTLYSAVLTDPSGGWSEPRSLNQRGADPSLCIDGGGRLHMAFQQAFRQLRYARSDDKGQTWSAARSVEETPGLFGRVTCHPSNPTGVAVTWEKFIGDGSNKDDHVKVVGLARSGDRGETFTMIPVENDRTSQVRSSAVMLEDGTLEVSWVDVRGEPTVKWETVPVE